MIQPLPAQPDWHATAFNVAGTRLLPDVTGALYCPDDRLLVVSDLHLEKGSSFHRAGLVLPPYDTRRTLRLLQEAMNRWRPATVVALGDTFHDRAAANRLGEEDRDTLSALVGSVDWIWICGNHDPDPPLELGGSGAAEWVCGALTFRHAPQPLPLAGEIAGHMHPCVRLNVGGRRMRRRCFVGDGRRLILPAMGAYAGGLDVFDPAFEHLFQDDPEMWVLGDAEVHPVALDTVCD